MPSEEQSGPPRFSVDTHLFRELGALLVGRDSTALVELIKNAYDADAKSVIITGIDLGSVGGSISVQDDGIGMTPAEFESGFLRIASRSKEAGDRRSARYGRRFTGAKGVGRLSAHKLAAKISVISVADLEAKQLQTGDGVEASIDWDVIESYVTLEQAVRGISVSPLPIDDRKPGTVIRLDRLRRRWTDRSRAVFLAELEAFRPPPPLAGPLAEAVAPGPLLFEAPRVSSSRPSQAGSRRKPDPGFQITAKGDFATGDEYWDRVAVRANWIVEVKARATGVHAVVSPTTRGPAGGGGERRDFEWAHPEPVTGPFFDARILVREGVIGPKEPVADFTRRVAGVRVYMEGFRVLPYGGPGDDWLDLDRDYARRIRDLEIPDDIGDADNGINESFKIISNQGYYGAVFLTTDDAPDLEMVVSREGFLPNDSFWTLRSIVRSSIDLSTRVRAAAAQKIADDPSERAGPFEGDRASPISRGATPVERVASQLGDARNAIADLKRAAPASGSADLDKLDNTLSSAVNDLQAVLTSQATLRILASVGQQLAEFVHETNGILALARQITNLLRPAQGSPTSEAVHAAANSADQLMRLVDRQASYLVEVLSPDSRRRRSRRQLSRSVQAAAQLVASRTESRGIKLEVRVGSNLETVPMFGAELTTVFTNLLTNAVKASGNGGAIQIVGSVEGDETLVIVENTGAKVDVLESERWFRPFESTTYEVDPVLGQGMGLGLPITRATLEEYGGSIAFVSPSPGYATAVEVRIPRQKK